MMTPAELQRASRPFLVALPAAGLLLGFAATFSGRDSWSGWIWALATAPVLASLVVSIVTSLRHGDIGLDIIAALSMAAALGFGEDLAAVVVALMYGGGQYLESFAAGRARREMTALLARVPRTAVRHHNSVLEEVGLDGIQPGDRLLIRQGDVVPTDGTVAAGLAILDQSALTGEAMPVKRKQGEGVLSGSTNAGEAFDLTVSRRAADSTYAGIVRLVEAAQRSKAPMSRLADRYALVFLAVTLALAGIAWIWSQDPIRAVAVLVVATPCPLILAVPIALVSGLSRAARKGILVKSGKALETLAAVKTLVIDKTGTLTHGSAQLVATHVSGDWAPDEVLRLAASLDQASRHVIGETIVKEARQRGLVLPIPESVVESPGQGIEGRVDGRPVLVGGVQFIASHGIACHGPAGADVAFGTVLVGVAVDRELAGIMVLEDRLRTETRTFLDRLRSLGVTRVVLASGDRRDVTEAVAAGLPIDVVKSQLTPEQKIAVVTSERQRGPVMMIGDGVNDAPALAAADIGVAMGAKGAAASAEAADIVLLVDRLDRVLPAIELARRSKSIALQSVYAGIGLSIIGMIAGALGWITPVQGALGQEAIDVAVILNALRALWD